MFRFWSWTSGEEVTPPAAPAVSVGGGSAPKPRRRHYVIGDRHVIVDDRTDIEWVVAALAAQEEVVPTPPAKKVKAKPAKPVERAEPEEEISTSGVLAIAPRPVQVNWAALQVLLDQSRRLRQMEVADVILQLQRRWQDEDEAEVEMLLLA